MFFIINVDLTEEGLCELIIPFLLIWLHLDYLNVMGYSNVVCSVNPAQRKCDNEMRFAVLDHKQADFSFKLNLPK